MAHNLNEGGEFVSPFRPFRSMGKCVRAIESVPVNSLGRSWNRGWWLDVLWLIAFGALSSWYCVQAAHALSATFDEPFYLRLGLEHWRTGSCRELMRAGAMPLAIDLQTLPLFLYEKWRGLPIDPVRDIAWALPIAREASLIFWWLLLFYVWRAGRDLGGPWAGRLAVAIIACEPTFLAHAALLTSDLPVAAALLVFIYEYRKHRDSRWPARVLLPAALYGLALVTKASTLAYGVLGVFAVELGRALAARQFIRQKWRQWFRELVLIVLGGIALTFVYCGSDWAIEPSFVRWAETLPPGKLHDLMLWTAEHLRIFSNAGEALAQQIKHNFRGHHTYILGQEYRRSIWFYFPVALTIKTTLPLLFAPVVLALVRPRALRNWAWLAAGVLFLFSINCRVQIGIRFMLPLLVFLAIGIAAAVAQLGHEHRRLVSGIVALCLFHNAATAARVWPEALAYTNELWGGTRNGYRWLSDSNYDWGQGLLELNQWRQQHAIDEMHVWYFGTDSRVHVPPLQELRLHQPEFARGQSPAELVRGKTVAVSTTLLYGAYTNRTEAGRAALEFFRSQTPSARTTTFFIYDFHERSQPNE